MISIITINFNNAEGLDKTIQSVLSQTYGEIEYIIIDGGSHDGSREVIEKNVNKISHWVSEQDKGIYHAMNKGIALATKEYLLFLNSGDCLHNTSIIEAILPKLKMGKDLYYGDLKWIVNTNDFVVKYPKKLSLSFIYKNSLPHPATFIKRKLFYKISLYNENLTLVSDWEFFMRAILKYDVSYQHLEMIIADFDGYGLSNTLEQKKVIDTERALVMKTFFPELTDDVNKLEFYNKIIKNNRFKILAVLEESKLTQKLNSLWLRFLLLIIKGKKVKDL